jgi:hypothetical protein
MIKTIAIIGVVLLAGILILAATKPDTFRVQRAASIKAPPEKIFPFINDLHGFLRLDFVRPFEAHNIVEFTLAARGDSTDVTWAMQGPTPYVAKVMHVFFDMDSMVGKDFAAGLASLKTVVEK